MRYSKITVLFTIVILLLLFGIACNSDDPIEMPPEDCSEFVQTPYEIKYPYPEWPVMEVPADNPLTVEGVKLGRMLFWDPMLSNDSTLACAGCHAPNASYSDPERFSVGIDGISGNRNAMALVNLAWQDAFFWDGRSQTLEEQVLEPVPNPIEMHLSWKEAITRINRSPRYNLPLRKAFSVCEIDSSHAAKALAQFLRTMISGNSKYDKVIYKQADFFTDEELHGYDKFFIDDLNGHCHHCHSTAGVFFFKKGEPFKNNGLDAIADIQDFIDPGVGGETGFPEDYGMFKTTTLRNIELTAPYMHDGRFNSLVEVLNHYENEIKNSPTLSPIMKTDFVDDGGLIFDDYDRQSLIAFLKTLTDWEFVNDTSFQSPF